MKTPPFPPRLTRNVSSQKVLRSVPRGRGSGSRSFGGTNAPSPPTPLFLGAGPSSHSVKQGPPSSNLYGRGARPGSGTWRVCVGTLYL